MGLVGAFAPEFLDNTDAEGVRVPGAATDSFREDDSGLVGVREPLPKDGRGNRLALHDDVVREVPEDHHLVRVRAVVRDAVAVVDGVAADGARGYAEATVRAASEPVRSPVGVHQGAN